jgi:hypothetical protein
MEMNDILKWGLVAAGAWLAIDWFQKQQQAVPPPANGYLPPAGTGDQPAANGGNAATNGSAAGNGAGTQPALRDRLVQAAGATQGLGWDQWNYYHQAVAGSYAAEPAGFDRAAPQYQSMTVDQFLGAAGLAGLDPLYRALAHPSSQWLT